MKIASLALLTLCYAATAHGQTKRFLDCTFDSESLDDCDPMAYGLRIATFLIPGLIVAVLSLLFCPFFFCCRYICNCCGGRSQTSGCCCSDKPAVYSTMDIVRPKIYTLVLIALIVAVSIWGNIASGMTVDGLFRLADDVQGIPDRLGNHLAKIEEALILPQYDPETDEEYTQNFFQSSGLAESGENMRSQLQNGTKDSIDSFRGYVSDYSFVMFVIFCIPLGAIFFGACSAVCNIRTCIPMTMVAVMFLMSFVLWTGHGLFSALALGLGDLCAEVKGLKEDKRTILKPISGCTDAMAAEFMNAFRSIESEVSIRACEQLDKLCYDDTMANYENAQEGRVFLCPNGGLQCDAVRFGDVVGYLEDDLVVHPDVEDVPLVKENGLVCRDTDEACTPALCAETCTSPDGNRTIAGRTAKALVVNLEAASHVATALDTLGGEYGSCEAILSLVFVPFNEGCQLLSTGSLGTREASGLGGIACIAFIFVMTWGSKRFIALPDHDSNDSAEMDKFDDTESPAAAKRIDSADSDQPPYGK